MERIAIIADDLTGGADTGVQFSSVGRATFLVPYRSLSMNYLKSLDSCSVLSVYTNSRAMSSDRAYRRLQTTAQQLPAYAPDWTYKKIDSCLRGNPGTEIEAVMSQMDYTLSFIAPAYPEMGRTTRGDIHRIDGIPLAHTEMARDPVTPVTGSRLSRIIGNQNRFPVGHIALDFLRSAQDRLQAEIDHQVQRGVRHLVFDCTSPSDLDRIARMVVTSSKRILPVGSAGLASSLGRFWMGKPASGGKADGYVGRGARLLVCGTGSAVTRRQIDALTAGFDYQIFRLSPDILAGEVPDKTIVSKIRSTLIRGHVIIKISSSRVSRSPVAPAWQLERAGTIARGLGQLVAAVMTDIRPGLLFLTGGDTADAVLRATVAQAIRISAEVTAGVVEGTISGGTFDGLPVMTKAGAFGQRETLIRLHDIWQKRIKEKSDES